MVKKNQPLINLTITPREKDLGGFSVRRILPYVEQKMVGPFIFLDHMGPADFAAGQGMDVRPHPHIGLATVTYLFEGEMFHRDSMGSAQEILPGAVNWMTSGHGITHSERTGEQVRKTASRAHGLQSWVALPKEFEEIAPEFYHHAANTLPMFDMRGVQLKLVAGRAYGNQSPVKIYSPLFYVEAKMPAGTSLVLPNEYMERALYLINGSLRIGNSIIAPHTMPVFNIGDTITIEALAPSHIMLLGGEPLSEPRFIDWNFVSSSKERLEQAKSDWKAGKFPKVPGDDREFIPLP
ncbi:MAG: pirin family protein [Alphaproteobacteria bacterium]|jgi:redox-sensitive bicupin YhaK (pirin superfamily)|nr:pirin family protein [Candidatus Jidaibacter sp.]